MSDAVETEQARRSRPQWGRVRARWAGGSGASSEDPSRSLLHCSAGRGARPCPDGLVRGDRKGLAGRVQLGAACSREDRTGCFSVRTFVFMWARGFESDRLPPEKRTGGGVRADRRHCPRLKRPVRARSCKTWVTEINKRMPSFRENFPRLRRKADPPARSVSASGSANLCPPPGGLRLAAAPCPSAARAPADERFDCEVSSGLRGCLMGSTGRAACRGHGCPTF